MALFRLAAHKTIALVSSVPFERTALCISQRIRRILAVS
jgi:hypothetical protein